MTAFEKWELSSKVKYERKLQCLDLNELVNNGHLSAERAEKYKDSFKGLLAQVDKSNQREKQLLDTAKSYHRQLELEQRRGEAAGNGDNGDQAALDLLREDLEQAEAEAALAQEREALILLEVNEHQRQKTDISKQLEQIQTEYQEALRPQIEALQAEIKVQQADLVVAVDKCSDLSSQASAARQKYEEAEKQIKLLEKERKKDRSELDKAKQLPVKTKRQTDIASNTQSNLKAQLENLEKKNTEHEQLQIKYNNQVQQLQNELLRCQAAVERSGIAVDSKQRNADEIIYEKKQCEIDQEKLMAEQVDIDMNLRTLQSQLRREQEVMGAAAKDKDQLLRTYKRSEQQLKHMQAQIAPIQQSKKAIVSEQAQTQKQLVKQQSELKEIHQQVEVLVRDYLREETKGKGNQEMFKTALEQVNVIDLEVRSLKMEEYQRVKVIKSLTSSRDKFSRQTSNVLRLVKEAHRDIGLKDVALKDLTKRHLELRKQQKDYQALHDLVKNQRNKFVNLIQTARQSMAEVKEKLKMVGNEVDILRSESAEKTNLLNKARTDCQQAVLVRDQQRAELNKLAFQFRQNQTHVDEQIADIDKLNSILTGIERELITMKQQYEQAIQSRNFTGLSLIDRNDELCVMYEKAHSSQQVLQAGMLQLKKRDDEIRVINIQIKNLQRSITVIKKIQPQIPVLDDNVAVLQKQLLAERAEVERLSEALTTTEAENRWKQLPGRLPTKEELLSKEAQLEDRVNKAKESNLERDLIVQELVNMSDKLRNQAADGREDAIEVARKINKYQNTLHYTMRKFKAVISELSMSQAISIKLASENQELEIVVKTARLNLADGKPPTKDAEMEWERTMRQQEVIEDYQRKQREIAALVEARGGNLLTTAMPRPNAYIPGQLGIPQPYAVFSPFKPTQAGSTMRHIRHPNPPDIEI